jgi:two-component system, response regulator PdtaR
VGPAESIKSQLGILHRASEIVSSGMAVEPMLAELVSIAVEVTRCDACLVYLLNSSNGDLVLRASQLPHPAELGAMRLKAGEGVAGWVAEHKSVLAFGRNAASDARFKRFATLIEDTYEALLSAPLLSGGDTVGVINVHHREPRDHPLEEVALLGFLGQQMGGVIVRARLLEENARLQEETVEMKRQLETRKLIERAKGILQDKYRLTEKDAYERLRDESRRLRRPMRELAEAVITTEELVRRPVSKEATNTTQPVVRTPNSSDKKSFSDESNI